MNIELCWMASMSASCFYTAREWILGRQVDPKLLALLEEPARALHEEIEHVGLPADRLWEQLAALSGEIDGNRQLAEVALSKTVRLDERVRGAIAPLAVRISELESAVMHGMPDMINSLAEWSASLRANWEIRGEGLMTAVGHASDARLLVPRADVVLVYPTPSGGGMANLHYNSVCLEAVQGDPSPEFPELLRLAWLLAQLNVDLPLFSEMVARERLPLLAALAMLPPVLFAAEELGLARCDRPTARAALVAANHDAVGLDELVETLFEWWETYLQSQARLPRCAAGTGPDGRPGSDGFHVDRALAGRRPTA